MPGPDPGKKVFLSFSSRDAKIAATIAHELRSQGMDVWKEDAAPGSFYAKEIEDAIRDRDALLLLASRHSVGDSSRGESGSVYVRTEIELAKKRSKLVIPVALDAVLPEDRVGPGFEFQLQTAQYIDARDAIVTGDYAELCQRIRAAIHGVTLPPPGGGTALELEKVEEQLARGQWLQASEALALRGLRRADLHRAKLLQIVARLQGSAPLRRLQKAVADAEVAELNALRGTDQEPGALYLLGVLSELYYHTNHLRDPTGGVDRLRREARDSQHLRAKILDAVGPLLPKRRDFELKWKRPD